MFEVVGVAGDVRGASLTADFAETVYLPYWQDLSFINNWSFLVKTRDAGPIVPQVRAVLRGLDQELPIPSFRTLDAIVAGSLDQRRFQTVLIVIFGAAGLFLAGLGLYGVVSYEITKRTTEIGIRIALGARTGVIHWLVVRQALGPLAAGLLIGSAASVGVQRVIGGLLFGVRVGDPVDDRRSDHAHHGHHPGRVLRTRAAGDSHRSGAGTPLRFLNIYNFKL